MKKRIVCLLVTLLLLLAVHPVLADTGQKAGILNYQDIQVVVNGETVQLSGIEPFIMDGTIYLPIDVVPGAVWDEAANTVYIGEKPQTEPPSRCWELTDVVHEVDENEYDGPRTWLYDYQDIAKTGRYVIDYTWQYNEEYAHYTVIGECSDPPSYVLPDEMLIMDIKEYNENVVGNLGWGIMEIGYIQYNRNKDAHYVDTTGFGTIIDGEPTYECKMYNAADGDQAWQIWAIFPEGVSGETISFTMSFHRGDRHPIRTTWTYTWHE